MGAGKLVRPVQCGEFKRNEEPKREQVRDGQDGGTRGGESGWTREAGEIERRWGDGRTQGN